MSVDLSTVSLSNVSEALAGLVSAASEFVVAVVGRGRPSTGLVWSADGLVLTADHSLEGDEFSVILPGGARVEASLVGRDSSTDLALLRVKSNDLTPPKLADPAAARPGHLVLSLGRTRGGLSTALGVLRASGGAWRTAGGGQIDRFLDVDGSLPRGGSGGPLLDASGALLGLNTAALVRGGTTIPVGTLQRVVTSLLAHGRIQRAYLGLGAVPARLPARFVKVAGQEAALLVVSVESDGPADQAGLLLGDVLLGVEGVSLSAVGDLLAQLGEDRVGKPINLRLLRAGAPTEISVVAGARPVGGC